ncbi:transmembrane protein 273 isoform 2-T2 [Discoglossus pictus]
MGPPTSWSLLTLTVTLLSIGGVCTEGREDDEPEVKYAIIGACVGAVLAVTFIAIKLYMIKKHMLDNAFSDMDMGRY